MILIVTDINDCSTSPCDNGGTCTDGINTYTCQCSDGYTGNDCQTGTEEYSITFQYNQQSAISHYSIFNQLFKSVANRSFGMIFTHLSKFVSDMCKT